MDDDNNSNNNDDDDTKIKMPNANWNETIYWTLHTLSLSLAHKHTHCVPSPFLHFARSSTHFSPLFVHDMSIENGYNCHRIIGACGFLYSQIRFSFICIVSNVNRHSDTCINMYNVQCALHKHCKMHTHNKQINVYNETYTRTETQRVRRIKMQTDVNFRLFEMPKMQFSLLSLVTLLFGHYFIDRVRENTKKT